MKKIIIAILLLPALTMAGHDQGSGENGINGKPIESYAVDIRTLAAYKSKVVAIEKLLLTKLPEFSKDFVEAATSKTWYFVPTPLQQLTSHRIGIPILGHTEQLALQTSASVWIDDNKFQTMSISLQADLLVHELVVSLVMDYVDRLRGSGNPGCKTSSSCDTSLAPEDYEKVRTLTDLFLRNLEATTSRQLAEKLYQLIWLRYAPQLESVVSSLSELADILKSQQLRSTRNTGLLPSYLIAKEIAGPMMARCRYDIAYSAVSGALTIGLEVFDPTKSQTEILDSGDLIPKLNEQVVRAKKTIVFDPSATIETNNEETWVSKILDEPAVPKVGDQRKVAYIRFDDERTSQVGVVWEIYLYSSKTKQYSWETNTKSFPSLYQPITEESSVVCKSSPI